MRRNETPQLPAQNRSARSRVAWALASRSVLTAVLLVVLLTPTAIAGVGDYRCDDPGQVYYGNARLFRSPCTISLDRVYRHIREYREILERGLRDDDPKYHLLMKKASQRFSEAVKQMARDLQHDLVAETGGVRKARPDDPDIAAIPDRTDEVIANLGN